MNTTQWFNWDETKFFPHARETRTTNFEQKPTNDIAREEGEDREKEGDLTNWARRKSIPTWGGPPRRGHVDGGGASERAKSSAITREQYGAGLVLEPSLLGLLQRKEGARLSILSLEVVRDGTYGLQRSCKRNRSKTKERIKKRETSRITKKERETDHITTRNRLRLRFRILGNSRKKSIRKHHETRRIRSIEKEEKKKSRWERWKRDNNSSEEEITSDQVIFQPNLHKATGTPSRTLLLRIQIRVSQSKRCSHREFRLRPRTQRKESAEMKPNASLALKKLEQTSERNPSKT